MRLLVPALLAVLLLAPLGPAAAQPDVAIQLGMSMADARAALPGAEDVPTNENRSTPLLHRKAPLRWAGRTWTSAFVHFGTDDRVRSISLGAEPTQRAELEAWLTGRYGPPPLRSKAIPSCRPGRPWVSTPPGSATPPPAPPRY